VVEKAVAHGRSVRVNPDARRGAMRHPRFEEVAP
jgi:hypothetical protein